MGREVRRVPKNWVHPEDGDGFIPLFGGSFSKDLAEWQEGKRQWDRGFIKDWRNGGWKPKDKDIECATFEEWDGTPPEEKDYMPDWPDAERTHWQMYECTSEGTPLSPVMDSPEKLARWLFKNNASAFADQTASYQDWLAMIRAGSSVSAIVIPGEGMVSGVEGERKIVKRETEKN